MNTSEYHSKHTFRRCHTCRHLTASHLCDIPPVLGYSPAPLLPDGEHCNFYRPLHSGHLHDQTSAMKGGQQ